MDSMVNSLRSRESLFREESDLNMVNCLRSRQSLFMEESDLNMFFKAGIFRRY